MAKNNNKQILLTLGSRIKTQRKNLDIKNQDEFVKYLDNHGLPISKSSVGNWEAGANAPQLDDLCLIADALNCSTDYLLGRTDFTKPDKENLYHVAGIDEDTINVLEAHFQKDMNGATVDDLFYNGVSLLNDMICGGLTDILDDVAFSFNTLQELKNKFTLLSNISQTLAIKVDDAIGNTYTPEASRHMRFVISLFQYLQEQREEVLSQMENEIDGFDCSGADINDSSYLFIRDMWTKQAEYNIAFNELDDSEIERIVLIADIGAYIDYHSFEFLQYRRNTPARDRAILERIIELLPIVIEDKRKE